MDLILQAWNPVCQTLPGGAITEPFMYYSVYFLMIVRVRGRWTAERGRQANDNSNFG